LPGIPLLLMRPDLEATLVEPTAKRVAFLRTAIREAGVQGRTQVVTGRVGQGEVIESGDWDAALARAVWSPDEWVSLGARLVKRDGTILAYCVSPAEAARLAPLQTLAYAADRWLAVVPRRDGSLS
jgi:16S rRNA (guanine527-N7)-methyltransferase